MKLLCAASFSVSVHPFAGDPIKWPLGKMRGQWWHKRVKEMLVLALGLGRGSADLRAGRGVPHSARMAAFLSSRPVVYFDFPCMQVYGFTIVSGPGGEGGGGVCLTLVFETTVFLSLKSSNIT